MFLHNATHRWQQRRLQAAAPLRVGWSGGLEPPNAGRRTSIIMQNNSSHPAKRNYFAAGCMLRYT
jgi:hypothetical protein